VTLKMMPANTVIPMPKLLGIVATLIVLPPLCRADLVVQFLDTTDAVTINIPNEPGVINPTCSLPESCTDESGFPGFSSPGINLSFNIFDPDGVTLSDTLNIASPAGDEFITSIFNSDTEGTPLAPLAGGTSLIETGALQTAATIPITGTRFGNFIIQFQSDVESPVPEPSALPVLFSVLAIVLVARKRRFAQRPQSPLLNTNSSR